MFVSTGIDVGVGAAVFCSMFWCTSACWADVRQVGRRHLLTDVRGGCVQSAESASVCAQALNCLSVCAPTGNEPCAGATLALAVNGSLRSNRFERRKLAVQ